MLYLPYVLMGAALVLAWWPLRRCALAIFALACVAGLTVGVVQPLGLVFIAAMAIALWAPWMPVKLVSYAAFLFLAEALSNHLAPGFDNLVVMKGVKFAENSLPFSMYLNFDKAAVGFFLLLIYLERPAWKTVNFKIAGLTFAALVALMFPLALLTGYAGIDPKFPEGAGIWFLNNLFFVCIAEEALYRGFIQNYLSKKMPASAAIVTGAIAFGLNHWRGGPAFIAMATVAGVFYGWAYHRTGRLEVPIMVHVTFNVLHFFAFSYPALMH